MSDLRRTLEREMEQIRPPGFSIETVERRGRRRRRRQRIGAALMALAIAALGIGVLARALLGGQYRPAAEPNGRIVFISPGGGGSGDRLFTAAADGSDLVAVADIHAEYPEWSPDGSAIAFDDGQNLNGSTRRIPNGHIYTVSPDGSNLERIDADGRASAPSWSADGSRLAVASRRVGVPPGIAWLDIATGATTAVTENPFGYWDAEPDVSPDGSSIVFVRIRQLIEHGGDRNLAALFVVGADGSGLHRLTPWTADAGTPAWSPDGTRIAFDVGDHAVGSDRNQIVVVNADGSGRRTLTDEPVSGFWPTWSPDGSTIIFTRWNSTFELARIPSDGGAATTLALPIAGSNEADWRPAG